MQLRGYVYAICNIHTGQAYIGRTRNLDSRVKQHFQELRRGKHHCRPLQEAFYQFGEESFTVASMSGFGTGRIHTIAEHNWIRDWRDNCYNMLRRASLAVPNRVPTRL